MKAEDIITEANCLYFVHQGKELFHCLDFLLDKKLKGFIELGSANGGSFHCWARAISTGPKVSVDWNKGFGMSPSGRYGEVAHEIEFETVKHRNNIWRSRFSDVRTVEGNCLLPETVESCKTVLNGDKVDWLFIDADHTYSAASRDLVNYSQFVRPGGYIGFHDIYFDNGMNIFWSDIKRHHEKRGGKVFEFPTITSVPTEFSWGIGVLQL